MIKAKPVVANQYWILKQDERKIGNVMADGNGYTLTINNSTSRFKTIKNLERLADIKFETVQKTARQPNNLVHGYDAGCRVYNAIWDVKHKLPLFTKNSKSKSWLAAGWYLIKQYRNWQVVRNPKLIVLERYPYQGPFHTQEEANVKSV
jgi:hypothetical protein